MSAPRQHSRIPELLPKRFLLATAIVFILGGGIFLLNVPRQSKTRANPQTAAETGANSGYAGSSSCQECHPDEYRLWAASHHGLAQRPPSSELDGAAFAPSPTNPLRDASSASNAPIRSGGQMNQAAFVHKTDGQFEVLATGLNSTQEWFQIRGVLGVAPLRQFLVSFPAGRWQTLEASFDPRSNEWFDVFGAEGRRPGEWGHWTGRGMNWNSMCAACHNTGVRKNYEQPSDAYRTTLSEQGVGCEACHGPLEAHNQWQHRLGKTGKKDPTLPRWPSQRVLDNCGFCHARRGELTGDFKPGDDFLDHLELQLPDASEIFYPDGQVHEEDYEYAAFRGSRMHERGVGCGDCHNPHSAKTMLPGNWLCMRCHNGTYTNAPVIEPVGHSHHKVFGYSPAGQLTNMDLGAYARAPVLETGGECVNCHMPQTVYMQRHWRHDHGFTTPDPLLTKETGAPNACNRCHRDKNTDWAIKHCDSWYGTKMDRPSRQRARLVASARKNQSGAWTGVLGLLSTNESGYWRAVAAGLMQPWAGRPEVRDALLLGLKDTNALVRANCLRALEPLTATPAVEEALQLGLNDPVRGVRIAAAWALRAKLDLDSKAARELLECLSFNADQPAGQVQLGAFWLARGDAGQAATHYQTAVAWDPNSALIRRDYAVALSTLNRLHEAVEQLETACALEPTNAEFQYNLALAWNELGQSAQAVECLRKAVRLDPGYAEAWYNLGLALSAEGRTEEALDALTRAESRDRSDPRPPYARATILVRTARTTEALRAARRALEIDPNFEAARELVRTLTGAEAKP